MPATRVLREALNCFPHDLTPSGAKRFIRTLVRQIGPGFHPDTPMSTYVRSDNRRLFLRRDAVQFDDALATAYEILERVGIDPCAVALPVQRRLLRADGLR